MYLMQLKRPLAFFLVLCMVWGLFLVPQAERVYGASEFPQAEHAINTYYNTLQGKVLDDWEELAAVYAYLEAQGSNDYSTGVDISDYVLPATGTGAGGLFTALMKGDAATAATLANSLVSGGAIKDPGLVSTYAFTVLALEAYNRSTGISQVAYSTAGAIDHLLNARNTDDGYGYVFWGEASYDTAGLVLAVLSLPAFAAYPDIDAERSHLIDWVKAGQEVSGAFSAFGSDSANSTACVLYGLSALDEDLSTWTTSPAIGLVNSNIYSDAEGWFSVWSGAWDAYATKQAALALSEVNNSQSFYASVELNSVHYISTTMQLVKDDSSFVEKDVTVPLGSSLDAVASIVSGSAISGGFNYYEDGAAVSDVADGSSILGVADQFNDIAYFSYDGSGIGLPVANVSFGSAADFAVKNLNLSTGAITALPQVSVDVNADTFGDYVCNDAGEVSIVPIHATTDLEALEFTYDYSTYANIRRIPTGAAILPARIIMANGGTQTKTVSVRVEGPAANVVYYSAYDVVGNGSKQLTAGDAVTQALTDAGKSYTYAGGYLSEVDGIFAGSYDPNFYDGWVYYMNEAPGLGLGSQIISNGDEIVVYYGYYPGWGTDMVSLESAVSGGDVTLTIKNGNTPVSGVSISWDGSNLPDLTDALGQVVIDDVAPGTYVVQVSKSDVHGVPQVLRLPAGTTVTVTADGSTAHGGGTGMTETAEEVFLSVKGLNGASLLSKTGQTYYVGITARDVLDNSGLTVAGNGNYVSSINGLAEFDHGPGSGWLYTVNGNLYGTIAADDYRLDIDDEVVWYYTTDYTRDRNVIQSLDEIQEEIILEIAAVNGVAHVEISASDINDAIKNGSGDVVISPEVSGNATKVNFRIPASSVADMADNEGSGLQIETEIGSLRFSGEALSSIAAEGGSSVDFSIEQADKGMLSEEDQDRIGDRPLVSLSVLVDGKSVHSFGGGSVTVRLPYTPAADEDVDAIVVYYINDDGELKAIRGAYNEETGMVDFTVNHFSSYAVGYNKVSFSDVASSDWYGNAVTFLAAREITRGLIPNMFVPNATLTRGQFVVMLMRAYGIEPMADASDNFADSGNTYYTDYLAAAKALEITKGIGDNRFAPESQISRQDMFTLLYRALTVLNEQPSSGTEDDLGGFSDAGTVSDYARQAMQSFVVNEIVSGSGGLLNPSGLTTRAQMAQVLFNLLSE